MTSSSPLGARYREVRAHSVALTAPLEVEDTVIQSMPDCSPPKWHLGHTTWFFETFVLEHAIADYRPIDPAYRVVFNSYYESVGPQHPRDRRGLLSRPTWSRVLAYRDGIDQRVGELIESLGDGELAERIVLGLHHEQQHQELLAMDIKHNLFCNPLQPPYRPGDELPSPAAGANPGWLEVDGGLHEIGHAGSSFAFDNERPRHTVFVPAFRIARRLVTCSDWLAFIDDGGYERPDLWLSDGWKTARDEHWQGPLYWRDRRDVYTLGGWRAIDPAEPVAHVSYYEADAFARWRGARLPTEAEWEVAAPRCEQVDTHVWQWTQSAYAPYPGFAPTGGALGEYNGKFMCNQQVLRGGAAATPRSHLRASYRNFFYPHQRWCYAGVRLAT